MTAAVVAEVDFYPYSIASALLGISERQLRDDRKILRKKFKGEFRDKPGSKGLSPEDFRFLARYRQLAKQRGQKAAIDHIRIYGV